jgi:Fe-S cluster biogenesis protein NfuA
MKVAGPFFRSPFQSLLGLAGVALALTAGLSTSSAGAQAPYLLPYTIQSFAGGGTAVTVPAPTQAVPRPSVACAGAPGFNAYDNFGDGCPIYSSSVVVGNSADVHDVAVDQQGNVFFIDNGSNGVVRRVDARSGVVTIYAGSFASTQKVCAGTIDKYGDTCQASDGFANAAPYTGTGSTPVYYAIPAKLRGLGLGKNGDLYMADYTGDVVHKISATTGIMTILAGQLGSGATASAISGTAGYTDGILAFNSTASPPNGAALNQPRGIGVDLAGDVFIADTTNNVIRVIYEGGANAAELITAAGKTPALGYIYTIAGVQRASTVGITAVGDGGPAISALFTGPEDVQVDANGNVFIADQTNGRVRVIYEGGTQVANLIGLTNNGTVPQPNYVYTIMGNAVLATGTSTTNPGPVLATSVTIGGPRKLILDSHGNLFVADNGNNVIWFLDAATGQMRVVAGELGVTSGGNYCSAKTDAFGDGCPGTQATINGGSDIGVGVDLSGNIYLTDTNDKLVRRVSTNQSFAATAAGSTLSQILEVHFAPGDGPAASNAFSLGGSTAFTVTGSTCTTNADTTTDCLVTVAFKPVAPGLASATLTVSTKLNAVALIGITGTGTAPAVGFDPGNATALSTALNAPAGGALDAFGNTFIADTGNNRVVEINTGGTLSVVAGTGTAGYSGDGSAATAAKLSAPRAVTVTRNGTIYIADTGNNVVRAINPQTGVIATVVGGGTTTCPVSNDSLNDGCLGTAIKLATPSGLAADQFGNVYIADTGNSVVRELTPSGYVLLAAGGASAICSTVGADTLGNGCAPTKAKLNGPTGLAVDSSNNLYIADTGNAEVREVVAATGLLAVRAGTGNPGSTGNAGPATGAQLSTPTGVAADAAGNLYIADTGNNAVRIVNGAGVINTVAGTLGATAAADTVPGTAFSILLNAPLGVLSTPAGSVTILDTGNNRALLDDRGSSIYTFARTTPGSSSQTINIGETNTGSASLSLPSPIFTATGSTADFTLTPSGSNGCTGPSTLTSGSTCLLSAQFNPATLAIYAATYTESGAGAANPYTPFIQLNGVGAVLVKTTSATVVTSPAAPATPQFGAPFVVTTSIVPASCALGAPTCIPSGTVQFYVDGNAVGTPVKVSATGVASQTISGLLVGSHLVTASYSGDIYYAASTAPALAVTVATGTTTSTVSATPATSIQFSSITLSAAVKTTASQIPTGTVSFYAGTTLLPGSPVSLNNAGVATIADSGTGSGVNAIPPDSFGLNPGTYALTAVYSGDANFSPSTSAAFTLVIQPQPATFTVTLTTANPPPSNVCPIGGQSMLATAAAGTAQGSTAIEDLNICSNNTVNDTLTFSCSNMPANAVCTFSPTTLIVTPVVGMAPSQQTQVTLWTNVPPGVIPTTASLETPFGGPGIHVRDYRAETAHRAELASMIGWPVLLLSLGGLLAGRKRLRHLRLVTLLAIAGILGGGSAVLTGCSSSGVQPGVPTPTGTYTVTITATGTNSKVAASQPITFTVGAGVAGQE